MRLCKKQLNKIKNEYFALEKTGYYQHNNKTTLVIQYFPIEKFEKTQNIALKYKRLLLFYLMFSNPNSVDFIVTRDNISNLLLESVHMHYSKTTIYSEENSKAKTN